MRADLNADFWVEVRHRHSPPKRYTWKLLQGFAFRWESYAVSLAPGKKPVRQGKRRLFSFCRRANLRPIHQIFYNAPDAATPRRGLDLTKPEADCPIFPKFAWSIYPCCQAVTPR